MTVESTGRRVTLSPMALLRWLLGIVGAFAVLGVIAAIVKNSESLQGAFPGDQILQQQFYLDSEGTAPTWFSSILLFSAGALAAALGWIASVRPTRRRWYGLALIFAVMSLDEVASIHENFSTVTRDALGVSGVFYFAWVIPAIVLVAIVALAYFRFVLALPPRVRTMLVVSAGVYLAGALGMELVGGALAESVGEATLTYGFVTSVEELLEMVGLSLLCFTLLTHLSNVLPPTLQFSSGAGQRATED